MRQAFPKTLEAMEAESVDEIPVGPEWQYEPKWDGFRCLAYRNGNDVDLRSKSGQPLARYFPDIVNAVAQVDCGRFILDGEIVIQVNGHLSFDDLQLRLHPAESRVRKLAAATPAQFIVFDLLAAPEAPALHEQPLAERRAALDAFAAGHFPPGGSLRLSPATSEIATAKHWFGEAGTSLDGLIAKRTDLPYRAGKRDGMVKIKPYRTADCVIGGFRFAEKKRVVGSLLLGLYDSEGRLNHVGFCSGLKAKDKPALTKKLGKLVEPPGFTGRAPGGPSRWSTKRSSEWQPLRPELVVEVSFDHVSGERFRHGTGFVRWRPEKAPSQCTMEQLHQHRSESLARLLDTQPGKTAKARKPRSKP
ncbi:ATP-dependent DNA ligase [Opitutaceae bacterium EW11]|nr:ATP-dependent DNA ligase [Opitutaceae bacterium EW11]